MYRWLGTISVTSLLITTAGLVLGCTQSVVGIDGNQPPLADAGKNQTVAVKEGNNSASVWLDGENSTDLDGAIVEYEWVRGEEVVYEGAESRVNVTLPIGTHRIRLKVVDDAGGSATDEVQIVVRESGAKLLMYEDFENCTGTDCPTNWEETGRNSSLSKTSGLFLVSEFDGGMVYGTSNAGDNIHTHFVTPESGAWTNYEYSGRMMRSNEQGGVGVTFLSGFPKQDSYYSLRAYWNDPFQLSARGTTLSGKLSDATVAVPGVWYRFRVQVENDGVATHVRGRVWRDGEMEPTEWGMVGADASPSRRTQGSVGVWCLDDGDKWVDDLAVRAMDFEYVEDRQVVFAAGADQILTDTDGDGYVTVTLSGAVSGESYDCYRWREAGRIFYEGPDTVAVVTLPVGYHIITFEPCDGGDGPIDKVEVEVRQITIPPQPLDCSTSASAWRNHPASALDGVFNVEFEATPNADNIDGLFAVSQGAGATYADFAVLVRFNDSGAVDARNGAVYSAATLFPYQRGKTYHFRVVVDCDAKTYDAFVAPIGGAETKIASGFAFRNEQLNVTALDNWAVQSGVGDYEICNVTITAAGADPMDPVANAGPDQSIYDADGGGEVVTLDASNSHDPDGSIVNYRWKEGTTLLAFGPHATSSVNLNAGSHAITLTVTDNSNSYDTDTVVITISEPDSGGGGEGDVTMHSAVSRHGITWTFNHNYPVGEFANGDLFVVGPVTVTSISPAASNGRNGSMVNPTGADVQAYDSRAYQYNAAYGVTPPFTLGTNQSLVSTASAADGYTHIDTAAVLTCLAAAPPNGSFRPPYCGDSKPLYNVSQLRMNLLPSLSPVAGTPSASSVAAKIERVWLDHQPYWHGKYIHPQQNMPSYGREISTEINDAALMTLLNVPGKDIVVLRLVQLGIDLNGIAEAGGEWMSDGGHASGRKWPILFAGFMLNQNALLNIGQRGTTFGEDCQTFYVTQADVNRGVGYTQSHIGLAEWGIRHCYTPDQDNPAWDAPYRQCCTANAWVGAILSAHLLDLVDEWNHPALFEYQDRYMSTENGGNFRSWSQFAENMWDAYR